MFSLLFLIQVFNQGNQTYIINDEGEDYVVHVFSSVGTHQFLRNGYISSVDVLVVAGGGGGGNSAAGDSDPGGGGAGGLVFRNNYPIEASSLTVIVGKGGNIHENGYDSKFGSISALGGGYGGSDAKGSLGNGGNGGSGGGGGPDTRPGGEALQPSHQSGGYGNRGGNGHGFGEGGGGGGAGFPGQNASQSGGSVNKPGDGGDGLCQIEINSRVYSFQRMFGNVGHIIGNQSWFAGGGSGGGEAGSPALTGKGGGGQGGWGDGSQTPAGQFGQAGTPNTGGGGGGANNKNGGAGGSGIVVIRYPKRLSEPTKRTSLLGNRSLHIYILSTLLTL